MRLKSLIVVFAALILSRAEAAVYTYNYNGINAAIPDGNLNGFSDTRTISGIAGSGGAPQINYVTVSLNISGGYNGDLYAYLVHNSGFVVLLNGVGRTGSDGFGYGDTGFAVTLDDNAGTDIHNYQSVAYNLNGNGQLTGAWRPDGRNVDPTGVTAATPVTTSLSTFNGADPNGTWTLFLADTVGSDQATLQSWQLQISTVPEPVLCGLVVFAAGLVTVRVIAYWRNTRRQRAHQVVLYHP